MIAIIINVSLVDFHLSETRGYEIDENEINVHRI